MGGPERKPALNVRVGSAGAWTLLRKAFGEEGLECQASA